MPILLTLALSCRLSTMNVPFSYRAEIKGPDAKSKYSLVLTYLFYGSETDYKYSLTKNADGLLGKGKYGETVLVRDIQASKKGYTLSIDSSKEGTIDMNCKDKAE